MADEPTHDAELDALVGELERAELVETYTNEQGRTAYRLTAQGSAVGRMLAMGDEKADALLWPRRTGSVTTYWAGPMPGQSTRL